MDIMGLIKSRRSVRSYKSEPVPGELLLQVAEAGRYAPNAGGEAWHFAVIQNKDIVEKVNVLAKHYAATSGLSWLEALGHDAGFHSLHGAPAVIFVSAEEDGPAPESDAAAATMNMLLAAEGLGLAGCWGYFATQAFLVPGADELRKELSIPDGYKVYTSVMLGYRGGERPETPPRKDGTVTYIDR